MPQIIQFRRGTAASLAATNPLLREGEPCIETDSLKLKIGNGVAAWKSLRYVVEGAKIDQLTAGDDTTTLNATTARHGLCPKLDGIATHFLNGQGSWSTPLGGGDVIGPSSNNANYVPRWGAANSKTLTGGVELSVDGTLGDNSDVAIPTEKAIKTYCTNLIANLVIDGGVVL